jgi:hypothetical protein
MVWSAENLVPIGVVTWLGSRRTDCYQWHGLGQGVAAVYTGDGGGLDGSRLVAQRGAAVSRAPVAPAADGLRNDAG